MQTQSLTSELVQLSSSTHAWRQRHVGVDFAPALADLRPAVETFFNGAVAKRIDHAEARRLATSAVRLAIPADAPDGARSTVAREIASMLDEMFTSGARSAVDVAVPRAAVARAD